jgi:hypothetical protein
MNTNRRGHPRFILIAGVVLLLGGVGYYFGAHSTSSPENLVWMTPNEVAQALQPSPLKRIKVRVLRASVTIWNWYSKGKRQITMESRLFNYSNDASQMKGLPQAVFTNVDGTRCWILSPEEWTNLKRELKSAAGSTINVVTVTTLEGAQYSVSAGTMKVDCLPKIVGDSFDLLLCAINTAGTTARIQTNFAMAGRVKLPNGGAILVNGPGSPAAGETNCWYVLSSQATDPAGNSIGL